MATDRRGRRTRDCTVLAAAPAKALTLAAAQAEQSEARVAQASAEEDRRIGCVRAARAEAKPGNWAKHLLATDENGTVTTVGSKPREAAIARIRDWRAANDCP